MQNNIAVPILASLNIAQSAVFYRDLGFEVNIIGDYAVARREAVELHFWECNDPYISENTACYIRVTNVDEWFAEFEQRGIVKPQHGIQNREWGMREFYVIDNSGNLLKFGQTIEKILTSNN